MKSNSHGTGKNLSLILLAMTGCAVIFASNAQAQQPESSDLSSETEYGVWNRKEDASGQQILEMSLKVYPKVTPLPAFKHRLIPAAKDRVDGNAAIFYLKAAGFFEQNHAREQLTKLQRKWRDEATEEHRDAGNYAPNNWYTAAPESLPMKQVKEYLLLQSFQPQWLYDAARRTRFEHDRAIEREPNPIGYLLPSIQQHRELARVQTVRCRFAMAEGRIDDAVEIVGQVMAMGRHLGQDEFLVSGLVGAAIHRIGVDAGFVLSQQANAPNLYWAIAACREPAIDLSKAIGFERNFLLLQIPILKEVTETVRPASFWGDFMRRFQSATNGLAGWLGHTSIEKSDQQWNGLKAATKIANDYPTAREFLHEVYKMSDDQLDEYPKAQVVFLAILKFNELAQDEVLKRFVLPHASIPKDYESELMKRWRPRFNPHRVQFSLNESLLPLGEVMVPASQQVIGATVSVDQQQKLWQTVEALRMTAAENDGKLPQSLEQLVVPAPLDPATCQPFEYELNQGIATLRGAKTNSRDQMQIKLELANQQNQRETVE